MKNLRGLNIINDLVIDTAEIENLNGLKKFEYENVDYTQTFLDLENQIETLETNTNTSMSNVNQNIINLETKTNTSISNVNFVLTTVANQDRIEVEASMANLKVSQSISNLKFNNIQAPIVFNSSNNLTLDINALPIDSNSLFVNNNELNARKQIGIANEPMTITPLTEYASLLGISLSQVAGLFGISEGDLLKNDYSIHQLEFDEDHFTEKGFLNKKLALKTSNFNNGEVVFYNNADDSLRSMSQLKVSFGNASTSATNLYSTDFKTTDGISTNQTTTNLRASFATINNLKSGTSEITNLEASNCTFSNVKVFDVSTQNLSSVTSTLQNVKSIDISSSNLNSTNIKATNTTLTNITADALNSISATFANLRTTNDQVFFPTFQATSANISTATIQNIDINGGRASLSSINSSNANLNSATIGSLQISSINVSDTTPNLANTLTSKGYVDSIIKVEKPIKITSEKIDLDYSITDFKLTSGKLALGATYSRIDQRVKKLENAKDNKQGRQTGQNAAKAAGSGIASAVGGAVGGIASGLVKSGTALAAGVIGGVAGAGAGAIVNVLMNKGRNNGQGSGEETIYNETTGNFETTGNVFIATDDLIMVLYEIVGSTSGNVHVPVDGNGSWLEVSTSANINVASVHSHDYTTISNQGAHLQWNRSGSDGETWLINQKGLGNINSGIRFGVSDASNGITEHMRINENGNVGIGTNSPAYKLDVAGSFKSTSVETINTTSSNYYGDYCKIGKMETNGAGIYPNLQNTGEIGFSGRKWNTGYFTTLTVDTNIVLANINSQPMSSYINPDYSTSFTTDTLNVSNTSDVVFNQYTGFSGGSIQTEGGLGVKGNAVIIGGLFVQSPALINNCTVQNLYTNSLLSENLTVNGNLGITTINSLSISNYLNPDYSISFTTNELTVSDSLTVNGFAIFDAGCSPLVDNTIDLGSATERWREAYVVDLFSDGVSTTTLSAPTIAGDVNFTGNVLIGTSNYNPTRKLTVNGIISNEGPLEAYNHLYNLRGVQEWIYGQRGDSSNFEITTLNSGNYTKRFEVGANGVVQAYNTFRCNDFFYRPSFTLLTANTFSNRTYLVSDIVGGFKRTALGAGLTDTIPGYSSFTAAGFTNGDFIKCDIVIPNQTITITATNGSLFGNTTLVGGNGYVLMIRLTVNSDLEMWIK